MDELTVCPFCGCVPRRRMKETPFGKYEMTHYCFTNVRGNALACREITVRGETEKEVIARWNNQYIRRK